ncbi:hypothetical protein EGW08_014477 [Elysia chlorotica]|uniref:Medium-chain acyl-CoA ligase ACSF2, mitochondrial n=1 Tax=Elysia chlorotica TaxID=188477 RepID=A0A3S0ZXR7_ELYCH|nr:hypothetical protein EGW08_014477 [Elysia chlorotica]
MQTYQLLQRWTRNGKGPVPLCDKMDNLQVSVPGNTINELVQHWGCVPENKTPAFVSVDSRGTRCEISRADVLHFSKRFAERLRRLGIQKGHIVCNTLPNSLERVVCEFGILFAGASSMNGQLLRSDGEDFLESLRAAQCFAVITDSTLLKGAWDILSKVVPPGTENNVQSDTLPHLRRIIFCQRNRSDVEKDFLSSLENNSLPEYIANVNASDLATVMTTSGSTGYSKLVKLTHSNICHFGAQVKAIEDMTPGTRFINCAPMGWAGGYPQWYLSCGVTRYFVDLHDGIIENLPLLIWRTIVMEKIEYGFLSPMYVSSICSNQSLWKDVPWKPRTLCLAGQPVKQSHLEIIGKLCESVDVNYGTTECNLVTTHRIIDPSEFKDTCAGYPGYGVQIKIVDQYKNELPQGETGEVLLWSPSLCSGYMSNEDANRKAFTEDGWFCTDDSGYFGQDGKLYLQGRQSDSIHRGAYILYPCWLENKLKAVPGIKDVIVVPVPDPVLHNEICACVVVDGLKGVVAGTVENSDSSSVPVTSNDHSDIDEVDNVCVKEVFPSLIRKGEQAQKTFDKIRLQGQSKSLSMSYNKTLVKPIVDDTVHTHSCNTQLQQNLDLVQLEKQLRLYADSIEMLHKSDAMRLVPKYYVFMGKYPLTDTGKTSRKEIKILAASALHLSP